MRLTKSGATRRFAATMRVSTIALLAIGLVACSGGGGEAAATATAALSSPADAVVLEFLTTAPERGPGGTSFQITGAGLPAAADVEIVWATKIGSYQTEFEDNSINYIDRVWEDTQTSLGRATTTEDGRIDVTLEAPRDTGGAHDIYLVADGTNVAKAGFVIERQLQVEPLSGPVGTPIRITVTGLGPSLFTSTGAILYDSLYTGFVSATTTNGTASFEIRATGAEGKHVITLYNASHAVPYLNIQQSPVAFTGVHRAVFSLTAGGAVPENYLDWPDVSRVAAAESVERTTVGISPVTITNTPTLSAYAGPILSSVQLEAIDLPANTPVEVVWTSVAGNRVQGGWDIGEELLARAQTDAEGRLQSEFTIPDTLGGWHAVRVVSNDKPLAETAYYVERSLAQVTPARVRAGEIVTVNVKGIGWTELDNGFAVTYDNGYIGYACGFNSNGDVTLELVATGAPGVHLIDLVPMIYDGATSNWPWQYTIPQLTYKDDHPSLDLGYRLPAFRLAIEILE